MKLTKDKIDLLLNGTREERVYACAKSFKGTSNYDPFSACLTTRCGTRTDFEHNLSPRRLPFVCPPAPWGAAGRLRLMPRPSGPASRGGEYCRRGSASRFWRAPARCRSCARSGRPPNSPARRIHARCERGFCSWRGSLAFAHSTVDGCGWHAEEYGL